VYGNVAKATHGETVHQVLGDGDARVPFQTFPLLQAPLTYVQADNADGSASTLSVSVDGVTWLERDSLYGAGPRERVFDTSTRYDDAVVAGFGDGTNGARLPSGSHNVQATYRKGLGSAGNLDVGQLSQPMDRPLGLKAASNPLPAEGGADPEPPEQARLSMPLTTRTLGRAVSLTDYADFAMAFAGVSLADAHVLPLRAGRTIVVTVCGPHGGDAPSTTLDHLGAALVALGDPLVRVQVLPAQLVQFRTALKVAIAPDRDRDTVLAAVEAALRSAFARGATGLATPVHRSSVIAVAADVPGVLAVDLDLLYIGQMSLQERLPAQAAGVDSSGGPVASEMLALSDRPLDGLEDMS
jgi:predicted phage baseplate assembly protein